MTSPPPVYGGRYELENQIARGGTAQVYRARDLRLDRPVALKVLFPELSSDHSFVDRFRREAQAAANLSHPNIVPVFDWGESEATYFIVMELVDGEPLSSIIRTQAPLAALQAASIAADIAKALSYAHRHGVVHRDVKPGNVLITADGQVKVTDFGIARAIGSDEQVTQTGLVMGTATYFSPEQAQGLEVDGRSDVYALGVVLYEMLTGRPPFTGDNPVSIAYQHVRETAPSPRSLNPTIPGALEAIILQAMAKLPAERYRSADEFRADLDRFVHGQTVLANPPAGPATMAMPRDDFTAVSPVVSEEESFIDQRSTTVWWVAGGVVLLVLIGLVVFFGGRSLGWFGSTKASVQVPNVVGMKAPKAEHKLIARGFGFTPVSVSASAADSGKVMRQNPTYPHKATKGSKITLYIAGVAPSKNVPSVIGMTRAVAENHLHNSGFTQTAHVVFVTATQAGQQQGTVIKQIPGAGKHIPTNTIVTLDVINGTTMVTVPTLAGDSQAQAGAALANAQLNVGNVVPVFSGSVPGGQVVSSNPAVGSQVMAGTKIDLNISDAVSVPSLIQLTEGEAQSQLAQDGLSNRVAPEPAPSPSQVGLVVNQVPRPGTAVKPGYTVTIFVGTASSESTTTIPSGTTGNTGTTGTSVPSNGQYRQHQDHGQHAGSR